MMHEGPRRAMLAWRRCGTRPRRGSALAWILVAVVVVGTSMLLVRQRAARAAATRPQPAAYAAALGVEGLVPVLPDSRLPVPVALTLVRDPASAGYFDDSTAYDRILAGWRTELEAVGARVTMRTPAQLAGVREPLVVPSAPCLSPATRAALTRAADTGTGILLTWITGTRDAGCRGLGWGFLVSLVGAGRADTLGINDPAYVTVPAGGPLALGLPPGARLELRGANHVALRTATRDAHYGDAWLNPVPVRDQALLDGAVARGVRPRVAFVGFDLADVGRDAWNRGVLRLLVRNLVAHVAGVPMAAADAWPGGNVAAAVLAQDVEDEFANARPALDTLRAVGVRSTFFVVSDLAREHAELTRALAQGGELATHSEDHRRLGGAPAATQRARLAETQRSLTEMSGKPVAGLRPPEEQFDAATLAAWRAVGGRYVFASNANRCACPELVQVGDAPFVLMGRAVDDDYIEVRRAGMVDPVELAQSQLDGWAKVRALGGLYIMSYHSNMLARQASIGALGRVARALHADTTAWLTTAGEVATWWQARRGISASVSAAGADSLVIRVRNGGTMQVPAFALSLTLPDGRRPVSGAVAARGGARLGVAALGAGEERSITVRLEDANDAR